MRYRRERAHAAPLRRYPPLVPLLRCWHAARHTALRTSGARSVAHVVAIGKRALRLRQSLWRIKNLSYLIEKK